MRQYQYRKGVARLYTYNDSTIVCFQNYIDSGIVMNVLGCKKRCQYKCATQPKLLVAPKPGSPFILSSSQPGRICIRTGPLRHNLGFILNYMVQFNGKGMKQHFGVGIAFYIIGSFVQFFNNGLLLAYACYFVQALGKFFFVFGQ